MEELFKIQQELKAPKDKFNKFGSYKYRSCEGILESVKPLLKDLKCTLVISDDLVAVGSRNYVKAIVVLTNKSGESVTVTAFAREEETKKGMDGSQITGASSSYARKYALNGLFAIDDTRDSDATNDGTTPRTSRTASSPSSKNPPSSSPAAVVPVTESSENYQNALVEIRSAQSKESIKQIFNNYKSALTKEERENLVPICTELANKFQNQFQEI